METTIANSAAGTVISAPADPQIFRKRVQYQVNMAILDTLLRKGELSSSDHATACDVLACHYGLEKGSIFR